MSDLDIAEDLGARADQHTMAYLRVTVAGLLAGASQRYPMQERNVILDDRGLAHHEAGCMIEEDAATDPGIGMDIALEDCRGAALQVKGEVPAAVTPQPMRKAMGLDGMKALEIKYRLKETVGGGIAVHQRRDICAKRRPDRGLFFDGIDIGLAN